MVHPVSDGRLPDLVKADITMIPSGLLEASPPLTLTVTVMLLPGAGLVVDAVIEMTELLSTVWQPVLHPYCWFESATPPLNADRFGDATTINARTATRAART